MNMKKWILFLSVKLLGCTAVNLIVFLWYDFTGRPVGAVVGNT